MSLSTGRSSKPSAKQEVVKIDFKEPSVLNQTGISQISSQDSNYDFQVKESPAMKLTIGNVVLDIPNGTDPHLLVHTIRALKESSC